MIKVKITANSMTKRENKRDWTIYKLKNEPRICPERQILSILARHDPKDKQDCRR
jgi:hypothetical protein